VRWSRGTITRAGRNSQAKPAICRARARNGSAGSGRGSGCRADREAGNGPTIRLPSPGPLLKIGLRPWCPDTRRCWGSA